MSVRDMVSEAQAAEMIGWTPAALRCQRLQREAELLCEQLPEAVRGAMEEIGVGPWEGPHPWGPATVLVAHQLALHGLVRVERADGVIARVRLTRTGTNVSRRLRGGPRSICPPLPVQDRAGPVHYKVADVQEWLDLHPQHRDRKRLMAETISHDAAAARLEISPMTLRSFRSKAAAARSRIEQGRAGPGDSSKADRCPRSVMVGFSERYRPGDIDAWLKRKGRVAVGAIPC